MKNKILAGVLLTGIWLFWGCSGSRVVQKPAESGVSSFEHYNNALNELEAHEYQKALDELNKAIALKPEYAPFYYVKGRIFQMVGETDSAIVAYEKALRYKSYYPEVWRLLAPLYLQSHQYSKVVEIVKSLVEEYPDSMEYHLDLAEAYLGIQRPLLALEEVKAFTRSGNSSPRINRLLGLAYFEAEKYARAVPFLKKALHLSPNDFTLQRALGIALFRTGKQDEGLSHLNRALQLNPAAMEVFLYRARYFWLRQKKAQAMEQIDLGLQKDSTYVPLWVEKGKYLFQQGDTTRAELVLEKALQLNPQFMETYKWLGIIYQETGREEQAREFLLKYHKGTLRRDAEVEKRLKELESRKH